MSFIIKLLRKLSSKPKRLNPEIYNLVTKGSREALIIYISYCKQYQKKLDYKLFHEGLLNSAQQGNAESLYDIGAFHANGLMRFPQDYQKAIDYFLKAAALDHSDAMNQLALCYYKGLGVECDYQKMREWYEKSAALGNANASTNLGNIYAEGQGVEIDFIKAKYYFSIAAENGNANAMNNLSYLYFHGLGVEQNHVLADEWLEKAHKTKSEQPIKIGTIDV